MLSTRASLLPPVVLLLTSCGGDVENHGGSTERLANLELDATFPEAFSYLSGIRELSDGKILAADPTAQVVLRVDLDAGVADTLGRHGAGPQEYDGPDQVFPLPGDSTLLVDLGNGRLTVIDPSGVFVEWTPMTGTGDDGRSRTVRPRAVDAAGHIYADALPFLEGPADTIGIHRIDRASGEETPVARRWRRQSVGRSRDAKRPILPPHDDWAVGDDGRIVVVHSNEYSVDWFLSDGTVISGPPTVAERFPVGAADMEAAMETMASDGLFSSVLVRDDGSQDLQMTRGIPASFFEDRDSFDWPETLPVFRLGGTVVSPEGEAWVHRMMPAGASERVEVFDERGIRLGFVQLPPRSKIIAFGSGADGNEIAYVTRTDDMALVWLERYRILRAE